MFFVKSEFFSNVTGGTFSNATYTDSNASEKAIRNVKVKQKVSGLFKSFKGVQNYAISKSYIDTATKQ